MREQHDDPVQHILGRLSGAKATGDGAWSARCPAHDDRHASLSISRGHDGRVLLHCHAGCSTIEVCQAIGVRMGELFPPRDGQSSGGPGRVITTYDYHDADGALLYQVVRYIPKDFRQRRPDGNGGWTWKLGSTPRVPYRLPQLAAADPDEPVLIAEGEKDADNLVKLGFVATCNPGGAGKWNKLSDDSVLVGRRIVILPHKDRAGRAHAADVAMRLKNRAREIRVLELPGEGNDATDWIMAGGTAEELLGLIEQAPSAAEWISQIDGDDDVRADVEQQPSKLIPLGERDPDTDRLVLSPRRTLPTAQAFVQQYHTHAQGRTIHSHAGMLLDWRNNRYVEVEDESVRHRLQPWLHEALRYIVNKNTGEMELVDFESNPGTVNSALESLRAYVHLPAAAVMPSWIGDGPPHPLDARKVLPCRTMNLHIPTRDVLPVTPRLFTGNALEFDYDEQAPDPRHWLKFLEQLWPDDPEQIQTLQEWFGYCLTADTSQQKILLMVGPKRSGKGTIGRVLTKLIGAGNVAGPTTASLAGQFGLQPLLGKSLAIVSDARFSGDNTPIVVERLLCISGEDMLTIDRKFLPSVSMKLPTRFMLLTNELPRMNDASGALAGRFIILRLSHSFYGKEDTTLTGKLLAELPGILLWALEGWERLHDRGCFVQPASVADAVHEMEDLISPVSAFVRERCQVGADRWCYVTHLYAAWKSWCETSGRDRPGTVQTFSRDLQAAVAGIRTRRNNTHGRFFEGIDVLPEVPC